ncbi:MAG TPA: hypothetical protein EYN67_06115 [Flavobacteriales bacterium]|nr:hypothetical protein [Flavobacteriales bacterium]
MSIRNELLENILTATSGGALTPEQEATLLHFVYNPMTDQLEADRSIQTILSSLMLGDQWVISSGGDSFSIKDGANSIEYFPTVRGAKDQSIPANQDITGLIEEFKRKYSDDLLFLEVNGPAAVSGSTTYEESSLSIADSRVFGQEVIVEEAIASDDVLIFQVYRGTDDTGELGYEQKLTAQSLVSGDTLVWWFLNSIEGEAGVQIFSQMLLAKGGLDGPTAPLLVRPSVAGPTVHYVLAKLRTFADTLLATVDDVGVFGTEFEEFSSLAQSSTTSSSFQSKISVTTALKPAGEYRITFNAQATNKDGDKATEVEFKVDGTAQHNHSNGGDYITVISKEDDQWTSEFVVSYITLGSPATIDLDINYRKDDKTARISDARIEIWRVL